MITFLLPRWVSYLSSLAFDQRPNKGTPNATALHTILGDPCYTEKCLPAKAVPKIITLVKKSIWIYYICLNVGFTNFLLVNLRII